MLAGLIPCFHKRGEASPISTCYISTRAGTAIKREALSLRDKAGEGPNDGCSSANARVSRLLRASETSRGTATWSRSRRNACVLERVNSPAKILACYGEQIRDRTPLESRLLKIGDREWESRVAWTLEVENEPSLTRRRIMLLGWTCAGEPMCTYAELLTCIP